MVQKVKLLLIVLASFFIATGIDLIAHEGGHALVAQQFDAQLTRIQLLWLNIVNEEEIDKWVWQWESWQFGEDYFGSVWWVNEEPMTNWQEGLTMLMGSGSSTLLGLIVLIILLCRKKPTRFPWLAFFIVLGAMVDIFTYTVMPMAGEYITLTNPEQVYDVSCNDTTIPQHNPAGRLKPPSSFEPQVRSVQIACWNQEVTLHIAVVFETWPDIERISQLFVQIETPDETRWLLSNESQSYETEDYVAEDFVYHLPLQSEEYKVNQAFIVLNGLKRFVFFYDTVRDDGFTDPEPLYGATNMNINPYSFMIAVSALTITQLYLLTRYAWHFRQQQKQNGSSGFRGVPPRSGGDDGIKF